MPLLKNRANTKIHKTVKHKVEMTSGDKMEENKDAERGAERKIASRVDTKTLNDRETLSLQISRNNQSLQSCRREGQRR